VFRTLTASIRLELDGQRFPQCSVKYRISRCIREVCEDDHISIRERLRLCGAPPPEDAGNNDNENRDGHDRSDAPDLARHIGKRGGTRTAGSLQLAQVFAQFVSVLITFVAIFFEQRQNDPFQLH